MRRIHLRRIKEFVIERMIFVCGITSVVLVILIFVFLFKEGFSVFKTITLKEFILGRNWYPISEPPQLGIFPLILGSLWVCLGATVISIPLGVSAAVYIAEIAPGRMREFLKSGIELLAAIPSVVIGFIGMTTLAPLVRRLFNLPTGLTGLSGALTLAFMAMPTIVSIAEDALTAVPRQYKEGALALGASHWQAIYRVILPAALPGVMAAIMLGIGRVIGETMAVMMVTGNAVLIPSSLLQPLRTLTATIAAEMGETVQGEPHYFSLFAIGIVLFVITFLINACADFSLRRMRR